MLVSLNTLLKKLGFFKAYVELQYHKALLRQNFQKLTIAKIKIQFLYKVTNKSSAFYFKHCQQLFINTIITETDFNYLNLIVS